MGQPANLTKLRQRLYQCTEYRAEALTDLRRREWLVDVFIDEDDPILEIVEKLLWGRRGSISIGLAGGSGVGKTTQLYRLIDLLREHHNVVAIRVGYEDYSSLSSPPDITDFLLSIAGGFATEAHKLDLLPADWTEEGLNERLMGVLRRLRVAPEVSAGPVKVTASLREDDSFRKRLRDHLAGQVAQLVSEVRAFLADIASKVEAGTSGCVGVVLIVDSTERLSAPASAEGEMQAAVRNLFIQNGENLCFDGLASIYLLPPWLPITDGGALRLDTVMFPSVRVTKRDGTDDPRGLQLLHDIVLKRMPEINELIAPSDLEELCRISGGVQRVLFRLLKDVAGRARRATVVPIDRSIVDTSIDSIRQEYLAITAEAAPSLLCIDETKNVDGLKEDALAQLGRYFQALAILQVANGEKWFAIHPLVRSRLNAVLPRIT